MIVYSPSIGRYVPLRDLPAQDLIALAEALRTFEPSQNERAHSVLLVCDVWAEVGRRRELPLINNPDWLSTRTPGFSNTDNDMLF